MSETHVFYAGGPCSCGPARTVRYALPRVAGIDPREAVSCRADGEVGTASLRLHAAPADSEICVRVPELRAP